MHEPGEMFCVWTCMVTRLLFVSVPLVLRSPWNPLVYEFMPCWKSHGVAAAGSNDHKYQYTRSATLVLDVFVFKVCDDSHTTCHLVPDAKKMAETTRNLANKTASMSIQDFEKIGTWIRAVIQRFSFDFEDAWRRGSYTHNSGPGHLWAKYAQDIHEFAIRA